MSLHFIRWSFRKWKIAAYLQLAKNWKHFKKSFEKFNFLSSFSTSLRWYAKGNWKSRVCAWSELWIYWLVKNQQYQVPVNIWRFLWGDLQFKGLCSIDIATAGMHRGMSKIYTKHKLFHQSKLWRDVELQNTHIVLFNSPRDVMQVTTLKEQLRLGSELFDWYWNAASVPFGQLLIDLSPRTDDRLRYCTNSGTVPWKIYIPECLEQFCTLNDEGAKFFYSPSVPVAFPQMQKPLSSVLPKIVYPYSMRMHCKSAQRKLANHEKTSRGKISRQKLVTTAKKNNLEAEKKRSVFRKTIATNSRHYTSRH